MQPQLHYHRCLFAETGPGERAVVGDGAVRRGGGGDDAEERGPRHQAHLGREDCGGVRPNAKGDNTPDVAATVDLSIIRSMVCDCERHCGKANPDTGNL